ncbi:MAG: GNAT family N-acetyltransferase [Ignavibacteria bacterium]|nr:GNAT family N-acetyltransferase [Ignavibacteria bacterium]
MLELRPAEGSDVSAIDEFDIFLGDRLAEIQRREIIVAEWDNTIAGYIRLHRDFFAKPFIALLVVKDGFRRRGIAESLMKYSEELCTKDERIFTSTESYNIEMIRLLDKLGYKPCGVVDHIQKESEIFFSKVLRLP